MCLGQTVAVCLQAGYLLRRLDWQHAAVRNMQLLAPLSDETQSFAKTGSGHTYGALIHGALSTGRGAKTRSGVRQVAAVRMTQAMHRAAAKRSNKTAVSEETLYILLLSPKKVQMLTCSDHRGRTYDPLHVLLAAAVSYVKLRCCYC